MHVGRPCSGKRDEHRSPWQAGIDRRRGWHAASAVRQALADNGARVVDIDIGADASTASSDPFALVLVSKGAEGIPRRTRITPANERISSAYVRHFAPRLKRVVLVFSTAGLVPIRARSDQAGIATDPRRGLWSSARHAPSMLLPRSARTRPPTTMSGQRAS